MVDKASTRAGLDPDAEIKRKLGYAVVDWLVDAQERLSESPVADIHALDEVIRAIDEHLPMQGMPLQNSLEILQADIVPRMKKVNHPRFHGYIPVPGSYYGALGQFLCAALNPWVGSSNGGAFVALELLTLRWIAESVGYPAQAEGVFTSGGSMANLGALAAARATTDDWHKSVIYVSEQGHTSMEKAAGVLGFEPQQIRRVPTDSTFRLVPGELLSLVHGDRAAGNKPLFLSANAGTTNTGSIDPLPELSRLCQEEGLWFHIDGAYGGFAALTARGRALLRGMDLADSLTLDPHKWLYTPLGHGCLLVNRPGALKRAFATHGDYLKDVDTAVVNFFDRGPELSRPARALPIWLLIRSVGLEALAREIDADIDLAELAAQLLASDPQFEVIHRSLSVVTFRLVALPKEDEAGRSGREEALVQSLLAGGDAFVSGTTLNGLSTLRLVVLNPGTDEAQIRRTVSALSDAAESGALNSIGKSPAPV